MATADSSLATLANIRTKFRRLTRSPSAAQISNTDVDGYINNYILYDLPSSIELDSLKKILTFYTQPNVESYGTNTTDANNPLYNFKDKYTSVIPLVYIAGYKSYFCQTIEEFNDLYPGINYKINIGTGNGVTVNYTGTLSNVPFLTNNATFSSVDTTSAPLLATDDGAGAFTGDVSVPGSINYTTGAYDITFDAAPIAGETVWVQIVPYTASRPDSILFFEDSFKLRPIPDMAYKIDVIVYQRPTELLLTTDIPELARWWQLIAYGSSIKALQDRLDMDTVALLQPEFYNLKLLAGRAKIRENSKKRTGTIFSGGYGADKSFFGE